MLLRNLQTPDFKGMIQIEIQGERIQEVHLDDSFPLIKYSRMGSPEDIILDLDGAMVFPGLINSHDHLDFNTFPAFKGGPYQNYTEWGKFIQDHYKSEIDRILKIPENLRTDWGYYKNLLSGFTTVVNHGDRLNRPCSFLNVYENIQSIHSVQFDRNWRRSLNNIFCLNKWVTIHIGEGIDGLAIREIDDLIQYNFLRRNLVGIHGIGMNIQQASHFKALVWCPESNYFLFNQTAEINQLKTRTKILFGSDSTLTGRWNLWDHIRLARKTGFLTDEELYQSLTLNPSQIWGLNAGKLGVNTSADLVIGRGSGNSFDDFFSLNPEDILMIIRKGRIVLLDSTLENQTKFLESGTYGKIKIKDKIKRVYGDLPGLIHNIKRYFPEFKPPIGGIMES